MGAFFSLRGSAEWEQAISTIHEPSAWSNVHHSPLSRDRKALFDRPGRVEFAFPSGLRHDGDVVKISEDFTVHLIVCFEETSGRFYLGLALKSSPMQPHTYCRAVSEPERRELREASSGSLLADSLKADSDQGRYNETMWPYLMLYQVKEGILAYFAEDVDECEQVVRAIAESYGPGLPKGSGLEPAPPLVPSGRASPNKARSAPVTQDQAPSAYVRSAHHEVGKALPSCARIIVEQIQADLKRRFAVRCEAEEQAECTNCVVFCMRIMMSIQLSMRSYEIVKMCEGRNDLGRIAGEAVGAEWEQLWRRVRA